MLYCYVLGLLVRHTAFQLYIGNLEQHTARNVQGPSARANVHACTCERGAWERVHGGMGASAWVFVRRKGRVIYIVASCARA